MSKTTPATLALDRAGVRYTLATYDYDPGADRIGLQAAQALGAPASEVLKTLIVKADGKPACVVLASDREVSMKKLAAALGAKSAEMAPVPDAERITGYRVGGVSPFGQKRALPTVLDAAAAEQAEVFVNGGQRGLQVRLAPDELVRVLAAKVAAIS
ncbi:MAG: transcriptional regulator [Phenylobacterium sp.]|jgi:Cys-tRNA(Pro)/Cys-tRNA(Cys) deacylase|nr:transcriptional regulator [Phenylobacterium sp.]MDB5467964.1 transcriptional regulator [Phenylobacterium sp.]